MIFGELEFAFVAGEEIFQLIKIAFEQVFFIGEDFKVEFEGVCFLKFHELHLETVAGFREL